MDMEEAANLISSLHQSLSEVDAVVGNVNERCKRTILHIETAAQRLVQTITEHRHKLISKVFSITEAKLHALQGEKELVQDHFRAVEDVLRCAQNTGAVEDAEEWKKALRRQLNNLKGVAFDFQEYDEDMKFHFLYRDEKLLSAICKFGDVFTVPNVGNPKEDKEGNYEAVQLKFNEEVVEESVEQFDMDKDLDNGFDDEPLMEFQENLSSPCQVKVPVSQTNFAEAVMTQVFEETDAMTQLKEDANRRCKELIKEDRTSKEMEEVKGEGGDLTEIEEAGDDETVQDTIPKENRSGCSGRGVEHTVLLTSEDHDDEVFSPVDKETFITAIEEEQIKDLNNNSDNEWL